MAFDEYLLGQALAADQAAVRVYGWEQATVSLGYFQKDSRSVDVRFEGVPNVRRLSGGGAILHHHEITYSIALPKSHRVANNPGELYELAHAAIINELAVIGVQANRRGDVNQPNDEPFLCFARQDPNDIVLRGTKIAGSAQRRRRGAVLQHGSILVRASELAPELPGISELSPGASVSAIDRTRIGRSIALLLASGFDETCLADAETKDVEGLVAKYERVE